MKIAFITVYYNSKTKEYAEELKKQIETFHILNSFVVLIDNTVDNRGYAAGVNRGIQEALKQNANILIILNPDIAIKNITYDLLMDASRHFDIWGGMMKQNDKIYYGGVIDKWRLSGGLIERELKGRFTNVDFISGSFIVIKREVIEKIGIWDERFFMYYEDVEYCTRAKQAGFKVGIDKELQYTHYEMSNSDNPRKELMLATSRFKFFWQYSSLRQKLHELLRLPKTSIEYLPLLLNLFLQSKFYFNFLSLNISSFTNKFLNFILFIFLIRLLSPSEYGVYTLVWAHIALLAPVLDMGTTSYGIVHSDQSLTKYKCLFSLRFFLAVGVSILTLFLAFLFHYSAQTIYFIFLTSMSLFSNAFSGSLLIIASANQKVYITSIVSIVFNFFLVTFSAALLYFTSNITLLFELICLFYGIYTLINFLLVTQILFEKKQIKSLFIYGLSTITSFNWKQWMTIIQSSFLFVLIGLFSTIYFKADIFLLNKLKGDSAVGLYSAGFKFFDAFLIISTSYNIAATPIYNKLLKTSKENLYRRIRYDIVFLLGISFLVIAAVWFIFPIVLTPFLQDFDRSLNVLRIVIFALPFIFISTIHLNILYLINKTQYVLYVFIIQAVINLSLNLLLIPHYSYIASAYISVVSEIINVILVYFCVTYFLNKHESVS